LYFFPRPLPSLFIFPYTTLYRSMPMIDKSHITTAQETLQKYARGKQSLDKRIIDNDQWYRLRHWDVVGTNDPAPASAWLFNSLADRKSTRLNSSHGSNSYAVVCL